MKTFEEILLMKNCSLKHFFILMKLLSLFKGYQPTKTNQRTERILSSWMKSNMIAVPPILGGDLKISDQNNWGGGPEQKNKFWRELNLMGNLKFQGGPMNPNYVMVVVLKDIFLCWLGFRFMYIVYISWYYL